MIDRVGVIGAGQMGLGIAASAARAGLRTGVHDIDPVREALACDAGLEIFASPADVGRRCQVIVVVVIDAGQIEQVLDGPEGLLGALSPGAVVLFCSTIAPADAARFCASVAATGAMALDAPISGGPARALAGTMSIMLAGAADALRVAEPLLEAVAGRRFLLGEQPGDASRAKLVNNLMAGIHLMAAAEAVALAERLGLDPALITELVGASSGQSWMADDRLPRALAGDLEPRAQSHVLAKDVRLANEAARDAGVELPLGCVAGALFERLCEGEWRHLDDASALAFYRRRFGG
jgi:3-hydroxyisobutyrate dehydrogenase